MINGRIALVLVTLAFGCGSDPAPAGDTDTDGAGDSSTSTMGGTSPSEGSSGPAETTDDPTTVGSTSTTGAADETGTGAVDETGTSAADETSTGESGLADCMVWAITYDLTGSIFELSGTPLGAGDQVNTVMEPYDQDDHVGPGEFVLYFEDVGGAPGGLASMVSYTMDVNFVVDGATTVTTDISGEAGPEDCGVTQGLLDGTTIAWAPPQIVDYTTEGTVLCEGGLCGAGGLPNGEPVDMSGTEDQPITDFEFSEDLSSFTMAEVVTSMDANSTQSWSYVGTETSREMVLAPACACQG